MRRHTPVSSSPALHPARISTAFWPEVETEKATIDTGYVCRLVFVGSKGQLQIECRDPLKDRVDHGLDVARPGTGPLVQFLSSRHGKKKV